MKTAFINGKIFLPNEILTNAILLTENGKIIGITHELPEDAIQIDLQGKNMAPGLFDIQINGGAHSYFSHQPNTETLHDIADTGLQFGTPYSLPCLISAPEKTIYEAVDTVRSFMKMYPAKSVLGMHLEGPYLNPEKKGAHNPAFIRKPTMVELEKLIQHADGVIKLITIAPEMLSDEQIKLLLSSGIVVSAGHSNMTCEQAKYYFDMGIQMVTHLYNAMTQMGHRSPGTVGAVLDTETVYAPIILDGAHCDYTVARIAYKLKKDKLILISDAAFLGRKMKDFKSDFLRAKLVDGFYRNDEGNLAGAAISMMEAVQNAIRHVQIPTQEALKMGSEYVAKAMRMEDYIGRIETGYPAKFLIFSDDLENFETWIG